MASARFTGLRNLTAGDVDIRARRYVLATGSKPHMPPLPGMEDVEVLTNETLFNARPEPSHLLVLGGGPMGVEMAQAFRRLGAQVSLIVEHEIPPRDDPELAAVIRDQLIAEGVVIHEHHPAVSVARQGDLIRLRCSAAQGTVEMTGSHLLVASGRRAMIEDLGLDAAGVAVQDGSLQLDRRLRTSNRRIFAVGDVAGPYRFTHMAAYQAGIVLRNALFRLPAKVNYRAVPWVTYSDPELAHVGLSEDAARRAGMKFQILRHTFAENDRAIAQGCTAGLIKAVVSPRGRILGAAISGDGAGELIHAWSLAVLRRLKVSAMAQTIAPYPTLSEISTRAAGSYYAPKLFSPRMKRIVRLLQRLG